MKRRMNVMFNRGYRAAMRRVELCEENPRLDFLEALGAIDELHAGYVEIFNIIHVEDGIAEGEPRPEFSQIDAIVRRVIV